MNQQRLIDELKAEIADGRVVVVAGTGVSIMASSRQQVDGHEVARWDGLLRHGVDYCQDTHEPFGEGEAEILKRQIDTGKTDFLITAAELISKRLQRISTGIFHRWLKDTVGRLEPTKPEILQTLVDLGGVLATLNYDSMFEQVTGRKPVTWRDHDKVQHVLRSGSSSAVLHLHGYFDDPESVVLGLGSYGKLASDLHTQSLLRLFTQDRTLLFVGCGGTFQDPNFLLFIEWATQALKDVTHRHFRLCQEDEVPAIHSEQPSAPWLRPVVYGKKYEDLVPFLLNLAPAARADSGQPLKFGKRPSRQVPPVAVSKPPHVSDLPHVADKLIGREADLSKLDAAWSGPRRKNIVTIWAWGGTGKTSLVANWAKGKLEQPDRGGIDEDKYFDWSFYRLGARCDGDPTKVDKVASAEPPTDAGNVASATVFMKEALKYFGDPVLASSNANMTIKGTRLAELVGECRSLLILDGLEPLQVASSGALQSNALKPFLRRLAEKNAGLCLVTTRQKISNLTQGQTNRVDQWKLDRLSKEAGGDLLKVLRVNGSKNMREQLSEDVKGHALTLTLLGKYLVAAHGGDIRRRDCISLKKADHKVTSGHAFGVIEAYERWFERDRQLIELAILRLLGLFDRPATPDCLNALRNGSPIPGFTDELVEVSKGEWNYAVTQLVRYGLIEECRWNRVPVVGYSRDVAETVWDNLEQRKDYKLCKPKALRRTPYAPDSKSIDSHPLIREYFASSLRKNLPDALETAHMYLFEHLQSSVPYWPEKLDGLQPLYQSVPHGIEAGLVVEAFDVYWSRIQRKELAYAHRTLGIFDDDLSALGAFFERRYDRLNSKFNASQQTHVLGLTGSRLRSVGRFSDAIPVLAESIKRYQTLSPREPEFEALRTRHLNETLFAIGEFDDGLQQPDVALASADASRDWWYLSSVAHCVRGALLHHRGDLKAAKSEFEEAKRKLKGNPLGLDTLYSLWGFRYLELLLDEGRYQEVLDAVKKMATAWKARLPDRGPEQGLKPLGRMLEQLAAARADLELEMKTATCPSSKTVKRFRELSEKLWAVNRHDFRPYGLLAYAGCLRLAKNGAEAVVPLRDAWEMATSDGMKIFQAECWLECARLYLDQGVTSKFETYLDKVLGKGANKTVKENCLINFIRDTYQRRKRCLEDIETKLNERDPSRKRGKS